MGVELLEHEDVHNAECRREQGLRKSGFVPLHSIKLTDEEEDEYLGSSVRNAITLNSIR